MIPSHVLEKNTRNPYTFFSFPFQHKIRPRGRLYGRLCRTRGFCVQRLSTPQCYLSSFQLFQLKRWSTRSLNCISTFSCKRSVCVQVLTSFYGRFFVDERQFFKYTPSISSFHLGQPFFSFIDAASLWRAESSGSQPVYRKLFPHGPHSSKNNFFEIKISQRRVWETPSLSYYGSCQSPLVECGVTACTLSV